MDTLTVLVQDDAGAPIVEAPGIEVVHDPASPAARRATKLFIVVSATRLREVAGSVHEANRGNHLRALMVRDDVGASWITVSLASANVRSLRNLVVYSGRDVPRRILHAWRVGAQSRLIADAALVGDKLLVRACDLSVYEVPVDRVRPLQRMAAEQRGSFEIHPNGAYLHWPRSDVHLDLDGLRAAIDPAVEERLRSERMAHDRRFGSAVRAVRERHGLVQAGVPGVSERQVRRIEAGEFFPRTETLERLAQAHGLALSAYLDEVARAAHPIQA